MHTGDLMAKFAAKEYAMKKIRKTVLLSIIIVFATVLCTGCANFTETLVLNQKEDTKEADIKEREAEEEEEEEEKEEKKPPKKTKKKTKKPKKSKKSNKKKNEEDDV